MRIVRVGPAGRTGVLGENGVQLLHGDPSVVDALALPGDEISALLGAPFTVDVNELLAPVDDQGSARDCVGFLEHVRNTRAARGVHDPLPEPWSRRPAFYFANRESLRPASAAIARTPGSVAFDFEFEIAALIGKRGRDLSAADAATHIAGYVLYCDWSARDIQSDERVMQIGLGKAKDSAISLGPWVLSADAADEWREPDGFDFPVSVRVDSAPVFEGRFLGMDWSFEELVAYASVGADLVPGDLVASGTVPWGCLLEHSGSSEFRGWLQPGETVHLAGGPLGDITAAITDSSPVPQWRCSVRHHSR